MELSRFALSKKVLAPVTAYRRHRNRHLDPATRQLLETQAYRKPMFDFIATVAANPDLLTDVEIPEGGVAFDLGAYVGDWTQRMMARHSCTMYAFEPSPGPVAKMTERLAGMRDVHIFDYGLGAADFIALLHRDGPGSSLYGGKAQFGSVTVEVRDIVAVLDELCIGFVDVMKINIEGAEYDVLDRLIEADWLARIGTLSVQFHEWHPGAHRRRRHIRSALRRSHEEVWNYPWVWELWRRAR